MPLTFVVIKAFRPYGLYLWNDDVGRVFGHHRIEGVAVEHVNDLAFVGHLHCGGAGVSVHRHDMLSQALEGDDDFFSQLSRTEQQHFLLHAGKLLRP